MTVINRSALVPFSAENMFDLVDDINAYPQFLPWCKSATVFTREGNEVKAAIEMSKAGLHKSFTTHNVSKDKKVIEMRLVEGPFQSLEGYWRFEPLNPTACKISLDIEFEFSSKILSMSIGPVFSQICNSLVNAFVSRAQEVYGR